MHTLKVVPTAVPDVWLVHARFSHALHRQIDCRACHASGYALLEDDKTVNPIASEHTADILLPGIETCRRCHAPAATKNGTRRGGVRYRCVIDRYHNGDHPLQGRGASGRQNQHRGRKVGIDDFRERGYQPP